MAALPPPLKRSVSQVAESALAVIDRPSAGPSTDSQSSSSAKKRKPPLELRSLLATETYSCFKLIGSEAGVVRCEICQADPISRPHKSDLKRHLNGPNHMKRSKAKDTAQTVLRFPPRAPGTVHLSEGDIFQYLNISSPLCQYSSLKPRSVSHLPCCCGAVVFSSPHSGR